MAVSSKFLIKEAGIKKDRASRYQRRFDKELISIDTIPDVEPEEWDSLAVPIGDCARIRRAARRAIRKKRKADAAADDRISLKGGFLKFVQMKRRRDRMIDRALCCRCAKIWKKMSHKQKSLYGTKI